MHVKVLRDWMGRPYAFVQFADHRAAQQALVEAHNTVVDGRHIRIEQAKVNRTLLVSKMDRSMGDDDVRRLLEEYGPIEELCVVRHGDSGRFKGCAFVKYRYREDALAAFTSLRNTHKCGVEWSSNIDPSAVTDIDRSSIFVGQLNPNVVTEQLLHDRFGVYGTIKAISLVNRHAPTASGGLSTRPAFAFIDYESDEAAEAAVDHENAQVWLDRTLRVQFREVGDTHGDPTLGSHDGSHGTGGYAGSSGMGAGGGVGAGGYYPYGGAYGDGVVHGSGSDASGGIGPGSAAMNGMRFGGYGRQAGGFGRMASGSSASGSAWMGESGEHGYGHGYAYSRSQAGSSRRTRHNSMPVYGSFGMQGGLQGGMAGYPHGMQPGYPYGVPMPHMPYPPPMAPLGPVYGTPVPAYPHRCQLASHSSHREEQQAGAGYMPMPGSPEMMYMPAEYGMPGTAPYGMAYQQQPYDQSASPPDPATPPGSPASASPSQDTAQSPQSASHGQATATAAAACGYNPAAVGPVWTYVPYPPPMMQPMMPPVMPYGVAHHSRAYSDQMAYAYHYPAQQQGQYPRDEQEERHDHEQEQEEQADGGGCQDAFGEQQPDAGDVSATPTAMPAAAASGNSRLHQARCQIDSRHIVTTLHTAHQQQQHQQPLAHLQYNTSCTHWSLFGRRFIFRQRRHRR
ncbi:hypothetical protein BC831DRAFT_67211 [Entophlyctis helioformis]|nr:hypothetical protein BC831DRAFT_67211 [Entophlyctis helioformis]